MIKALICRSTKGHIKRLKVKGVSMKLQIEGVTQSFFQKQNIQMTVLGLEVLLSVTVQKHRVVCRGRTPLTAEGHNAIF